MAWRRDCHGVRIRDLSRDAGAGRLSAGRYGQDHVSACAIGFAWNAVLGAHDDRRARHAGLASSAGGRCGQGRSAPRGRIHAALPCHRLVVGPAGMGHLLGMGCPPYLGIDPVSSLPRRDCAMAHGRRCFARGARGRDPDPCRRNRSTDHQILGRLVEYAAPGRIGISPRRLDRRSDHPDPVVADGGGVYVAVRDAPARRHAQRDLAAAGADAALAASERDRLTMPATAHIEFIVAAYGAGVVVIVALITWVMFDYRLQRRILAELETTGVSRRSARDSAERTVSDGA